VVEAPRAGDGAYRFVVEASRLAREGAVDAIVTAPLNKAAMQAGGHKWPGHTELLAHEFVVDNFSPVLSAGDLYVFHLTAHMSLQEAIRNCTAERADDVFTLAAAFVMRFASRTKRSGSAVSTPTPVRIVSSVTRTPTSSSQRSHA
jgi:4-phospho-D-threonate 3-dehydrogenase / 4-phospho-D-erythronate 3-dehydrogenase